MLPKKAVITSIGDQVLLHYSSSVPERPSIRYASCAINTVYKHDHDETKQESIRPVSRKSESSGGRRGAILSRIRIRIEMTDAIDAELLRDQHRRLLPNDQRGRVRVGADVGRADGEVRDFEPPHAVHVQARIDDAAPFAGFHRASAKLAPQPKIGRQERSLSVTSYTLLPPGGEEGRRFSPNARSCLLKQRQKKKEKKRKRNRIRIRKGVCLYPRTHGAHVRLYRALVLIRIRDPRRVHPDGSLGARNERRGPARRERGM